MTDLLSKTRINVSEQLATCLLKEVQQLPDYEYYSLCDDPQRQSAFYNTIYACCPGEMERLVAAIKQHLDNRPYFAWLRGLILDDRAWVLVIISAALGRITRPAGTDKTAVIHSSTEKVVIKRIHHLARLHTDSSNWHRPNDITCLACIAPDQNGGGQSIILDVDAILSEIHNQKRVMDLVKHTKVPWIISENQAVTTHYHYILESNNKIRWLRKNIEVALDWGEGQLPTEAIEAIGQFEAIVENSEKRLIFGLAANDILLMNNRKCLHARTPVNNLSTSNRHFIRTRVCYNP